jgi:hypothetical protein
MTDVAEDQIGGHMQALTGVAVMVVLWASLAWGECAWILWSGQWSQSRDFSTGEWEPVRSFTTKEACDVAIPSEMKKGQKFLEQLRQLLGPGKMYREGTYMALQQKDSTTSLDFRCLPDTIDPRRPK